MIVRLAKTTLKRNFAHAACRVVRAEDKAKLACPRLVVQRLS